MRLDCERADNCRFERASRTPVQQSPAPRHRKIQPCLHPKIPLRPSRKVTHPLEQIPAALASPNAADQPVTGGKLHGVVKSGNIPLPGVTVTAQNTLTGKRYSTTTDITGAWLLNIPQNGRYVVRTQFAAFAAGSQEALFNATSSHDQTVTFSLMLASRAAA